MAKSKKKSGKSADAKPKGVRISNRRARRDFEILEVLECGIQLTGTEVKSMRAGNAKIDEAHARLSNGELFLVGSTFGLYPQAAPGMQHEPSRDRKLLVHKRQIAKIEMHVRQKGKTLIPLAMYFVRGWAKCEIGVAVGRRSYDKRDAIKKKQQARDMARDLGRKYR
ncbi:MAG: SsrA-binding protein SmpB [Phycisphaerae bacterium]|jgi:SsrA-binding protein|nr:SsrA-binding protein SmpB [Phycisphaerae bacterium]